MKRRETIKICIFMILLYLLHFVVFPNLFSYYYPQGTEATVVYFATLLIVSFLCAIFISVKPINWILGDIVYFFFATIYSANGAYNYSFTFENFNLLAFPFFLGFCVLPLMICQGITIFIVWSINHQLKKKQ